jgi:hypothetical protein
LFNQVHIPIAYFSKIYSNIILLCEVSYFQGNFQSKFCMYYFFPPTQAKVQPHSFNHTNNTRIRVQTLHLILIIISAFPCYKSLLYLRIFPNLLSQTPSTLGGETTFLIHIRDKQQASLNIYFCFSK